MTNKPLDEIFATLVEQSHAMVSIDILQMLYRYANLAAKNGEGTIVEIGAYRGASTIALALGIKDAGHGKVISIDPHQHYIDILRGHFSPEDHQIYLKNLERFGVAAYVTHLCIDSTTAAIDWTASIDLLWIDGDPSYSGVTKDIQSWTPFIHDRGLVIFNNHTQGSDVEAAAGEHLPFSRFCLLERVESAIVFSKQEQPRKLYLCGGMQSSGSTLVSWCFLQRQDIDGVSDMHNTIIHQDFSRISSKNVWVKMTIGAFRLSEVADFYRAQGWDVIPMLVQRELSAVIPSLNRLRVDGPTAEDPPFFIRIQRYLSDHEIAIKNRWPILIYENLISDPISELKRVCNLLNLDWDDYMVTWPKNEESIAYPALGSYSFHETRKNSTSLINTLSNYLKKNSASKESKILYDPLTNVLLKTFEQKPITASASDSKIPLLPPVAFRGTRRQIMEKEITNLNQLKNEFYRIYKHIVFGPLLKFWRRFINHSFPSLDQ
ncbi:MAG: class I SAM-dependent methyltransferase [Gammaproteobacteria bacterium]|nr:class I SAM-dependent methyltransferase [Gammaproteobacteria bacterium]